jgi:hypothetical protein
MAQERNGDGWFFLLMLVVAALPFLLTPSSYPLSTKVAACGGSVSFLGVLAMARNVLRIGPFAWIANLHWTEVVPKTKSEEERKKEDEEKNRDLLYSNILGPYLVGIGTVINGFSGYFG